MAFTVRFHVSYISLFSFQIRDLDREVKYLLNKMKNFKPKKKVEPKANTTDGSSATDNSTESASKDSGKEESKAANVSAPIFFFFV